MASKTAVRRKSKALQPEMATAVENPVERAAQQIAQLIDAEEYELAEQLDEVELERELGIDSDTVREAFRMLAADGLVELVGNGGARIPLITTQQLLDMLLVQDALNRAGLEQMVASPDYSLYMAQLFDQARKMRELAVAKDHRGILRAMIRYHELVSEASGNEYLKRITRRHYLYPYERRIRDIASFEELERSVGPYEKGTQALLRRDAARAYQCMSMKNYDFISALAQESASAVDKTESVVEQLAADKKQPPRKRKPV
ncbi:MAG: GntR family transcriptional regulator [Steroidobacteraceae bacterium]